MKFDSFHLASVLVTLSACFALRNFELGTPAGVQPYPRHDYGHALIGDDWYLFGGANTPRNQKFVDVWRFNFVSRVWTSLFLKPGAPTIFPRERFSYATCPGDNSIYMYGGRDSVWETDLWRFHVDDNKFERIELPEHDPLAHPSLMCRTVNVTSPTLYGFGGNVKENADTLWSYNFGTQAFTVISPPKLKSENIPGPEDKIGRSYRLAFIIDPAQRSFEFYSLFREQPWTRVFFDTWDVIVPAGSEPETWLALSTSEEYDNGQVLYAPQTAIASNGDMYISTGWDNERSLYGEVDTIYKYTFATQTWSKSLSWEAGLVPKRSNLPITRLWRDEVFVMAPGWGSEVYNDFWLFNVKTEQTEMIQPSMIFPDARGGQCSVTVGDEIYYFGGAAANGNRYADLWKFNALEATWTQVASASVSQPSGRSLHSCAIISTLLYVYGGNDGQKDLADLWVFDVVALTWAKARLIEGTPTPPARSNQISFTFKQQFWIYGGSGAGKNFEDMWRYDAGLEMWIKESFETDPSPGPLRTAGHTMLGNKLFVYGGYSNALIDSNSWFFDPANKTWEKLAGSPFGVVEVARGSVVASGSNILAWGGEYYLAMQKTLLLFESIPRRWSKLSDSGVDDVGRATFSMNTVGSKVYVFGGYSASAIGTVSTQKVLGDTYVMRFPITKGCRYNATSGPVPPAELENPVPLGSHVQYTRQGTLQGNKRTDLGWVVKFLNSEQGSQDLPLSVIVEPESQLVEGATVTIKQGAIVTHQFGGFYNLRTDWDNTQIDSVPFEDLSVQPGCFECAPGSVLTPEGTCEFCKRGQFWEAGKCLDCSAGLYGPLLGAASRGLCLPCPAGFYCPDPGSSEGTPCPEGKVCPAGASGPIEESTVEDCDDECWILPQPFQDRADEMKTMNNGFGVFVIICLVASIALTSLAMRLDHTKLFRFLSKCDIWDDKDSIGGTYTLAFVIAMFFVVLSFIIPFIVDNIQENSVLLPVFKLRTPANFTVVVTFTLPLGIDNCVLENVEIEKWFEIDPLIKDAAATSEEGDEDAEPMPFFETQVTKTLGETPEDSDTCTVVWYCAYCHLEPTSNLFVKIKDSEKVLVGANKIEYSVNTTSSYPDQDTVVTGTLIPKPSTDVFRGAPSRVYLAALPTLHETLFNGTEDTGLHISRQRADTLGEMVDSAGFVKTVDTAVEFMFLKSINYLRVTVSLKMSGAVLFALLIGLYAGLEGFFASMASQTHVILEMFGWEGDPPVEEEPEAPPPAAAADNEEADETVEAGKKGLPPAIAVTQDEPKTHARSEWAINTFFWFASVVAYILPFLFMFALLEE